MEWVTCKLICIKRPHSHFCITHQGYHGAGSGNELGMAAWEYTSVADRILLRESILAEMEVNRLTPKERPYGVG